MKLKNINKNEQKLLLMYHTQRIMIINVRNNFFIKNIYQAFKQWALLRNL